MIPIPTEIKSADSTDFGTIANILPKPRTATIRKHLLKFHLFDLPLELIFATVAAVVPAQEFLLKHQLKFLNLVK